MCEWGFGGGFGGVRQTSRSHSQLAKTIQGVIHGQECYLSLRVRSASRPRLRGHAFGATAASPQIATMDARNLGVFTSAGLSSTLTENIIDQNDAARWIVTAAGRLLNEEALYLHVTRHDAGHRLVNTVSAGHFHGPSGERSAVERRAEP